MTRARAPVVQPRPRPRSSAAPHTITLTIPAELGDLVQAALDVRNAENAMDLVTSSHRFYVAISGLLKKGGRR